MPLPLPLPLPSCTTSATLALGHTRTNTWGGGPAVWTAPALPSRAPGTRPLSTRDIARLPVPPTPLAVARTSDEMRDNQVDALVIPAGHPSWSSQLVIPVVLMCPMHGLYETRSWTSMHGARTVRSSLPRLSTAVDTSRLAAGYSPSLSSGET